MGRWGKAFIFEEMLFTPHVNTGSNPFNPIRVDSTIDDIMLTDCNGDPEKGEAVLAHLKAEWIGKSYYDLWPGLRNAIKRPILTGAVPESPAVALDRAAESTKKAREAELAVLRQLFPVGGPVRWKFASYIGSGVVDQHIQFEAALWVRSDLTKTRVKVTAYAIRAAMED